MTRSEKWFKLLPAPKGGAAATPLAAAARLCLLLLPAGLLLVGALRTASHGREQFLLVAGTGVQILLCCLSLWVSGTRERTAATVLMLYLTGAAWLWAGFGHGSMDDWYLHFAQSVLLVMSVVVFALQFVADTGVLEGRRAHALARRLAERKDWPADLAACRTLPEVKALREAIHGDAAPALGLLAQPSPQARVAALAALEFRKQWRPGQARFVLNIAQQAAEPEVRAAAAAALANVEDRQLVEELAEFLRDPAWDVRRAAGEALLWDTARRWGWVRHAVRRTLSDEGHAEDGALLPAGQLLSREAVADLLAWAGDKGVLAHRAAQTLGVHYQRALVEQPDEALVRDLRRLAADPQAPTPLRHELVQLLRTTRLLDRALEEALLDAIHPAPLRLVAADSILERGECPAAVATLRCIARLPNREMALATAAVVQRRLGVDLGLSLGQGLPPLHSRQAAEVTRRVMAWASQAEQPEAQAELLPR